MKHFGSFATSSHSFICSLGRGVKEEEKKKTALTLDNGGDVNFPAPDVSLLRTGDAEVY